MAARPSDAEFHEALRHWIYAGDDTPPSPSFKLWEDSGKRLACFYAPFDYVNADAKIILVGITPGGTQMNQALRAAKEAVVSGGSVAVAMRVVKKRGSFSGRMRPNIIDTLNRLGYQQQLGIPHANLLWSTHDHLVHFCSLIRYPVFVNGVDYNGKPPILRTPELRRMLDEHFVPEMASLPRDAILVPLGDTVLQVVVQLKKEGLLPQDLMRFNEEYVAPPHPSPANKESIDLLMAPNYETEDAYAERMYRKYLLEGAWKKKDRPPQNEARYKEARKSRWQSILMVREAYGLPK